MTIAADDGIVVVANRRGCEKGKSEMSIGHVPEALAKRLGDEGTEGLVTLLESTHEEWTNHVMTTAVDRFEYRLGTEISSLRVEVTREISALRGDMCREFSALRQEFTRDLSGVRVELLKWSFLFWIGQVAAMAGLLAFMLRK